MRDCIKLGCDRARDALLTTKSVPRAVQPWIHQYQSAPVYSGCWRPMAETPCFPGYVLATECAELAAGLQKTVTEIVIREFFQSRADDVPELVQLCMFLFQVAYQLGDFDRLPVQPREQVFLFVTMM